MTFFLRKCRGATNGVGKEIAWVLANRGEYVIKTIENTKKGNEMKVDV
jgi:short-subunit dehydrogenase